MLLNIFFNYLLLKRDITEKNNDFIIILVYKVNALPQNLLLFNIT